MENNKDIFSYEYIHYFLFISIFLQNSFYFTCILILSYSLLHSFFAQPERDKFVEIDLKPVCRHCYEKMPEEFKRRLAKREREAKDKDKHKKKKPVCL